MRRLNTRLSSMNKILLGTCLVALALGGAQKSASAQGSVYGVERFEHPTTSQSVLKVAVSCPQRTSTANLKSQDPEAWQFLVMGKNIGEVKRVSPSAPDDIPLDIFFVLPRDMTMLDAHEDLFEQLAALPYWLDGLGHRRHRLSVLTYSGCANGLGRGVGATKLNWETPIKSDDWLESGNPEGLVKLLPGKVPQDNNSTTTKTCGRKFVGADFNTLLRDILDTFGREEVTVSRGQQRGRLLIVLHDGRNVTGKKLTHSESKELNQNFDRIIVLQPDIAPMVWAREVYSGTGPAFDLVKKSAALRIRSDLLKDCIDLRGTREACMTPEYRQVRKEKVNQLLEDLPIRTLSGNINHREFITRSSLVSLMTGQAKVNTRVYRSKANEIDRVFKRPNGLDEFACKLAADGKGGLELLGGYEGQKLPCKDSVDARAVGSLAEVIHRNSPFAQSYTLEICVDAENGAAQQLSGGSISFGFFHEDQICAEGLRDFKEEAETREKTIYAAATVQTVCGQKQDKVTSILCPDGQVCAEPGPDYKWLGLIFALGALIGALIFRR